MTLSEELRTIARDLCQCGMCGAGEPKHRAAIQATVRLLVDKLSAAMDEEDWGDSAYSKLLNLLEEMKAVDL